MKIEAVTVCVNYSDFLATTLPTMRHQFDRMVVVTAPEDRATRTLCEHYRVECVLTDRIDSRWQKFNKGAGINEGLRSLQLSDWAVHIDADVLLPPHARESLEKAGLDPAAIYGVDRFMVKSFAQWQSFVQDPSLQFEDNTWTHPTAFPLGARFGSDFHGGYVPIGFFQLWNPAASGIRVYPERHDGANRTDCQFAEQWPRSQRHLIPEMIAYHLESEEAQMGANWAGRKTKPFGAY